MRQALKIFHWDEALPKISPPVSPPIRQAVAATVEHAAYRGFGRMPAPAPVLFTVPHAGQDYPDELIAGARAGLGSLRLLEDRCADALVGGVVAAGHPAIVARIGRAFIDLNRHPDEVDPASVRDMPRGAPSLRTAKLRGGLGLVPSRYHSLGDLWRERPTYAQVRKRVADVHEPYHLAVTDALRSLDARFGGSLLVDVHSMPPLPVRNGERGADIVVGDRFGCSADPALAEIALELARRHGFRAVHNVPYAGGYTLQRHARPAANRHALQIEFDRTLYLDAAMNLSATGLAACQSLLCALAEAAGEQIAGRGAALAAE